MKNLKFIICALALLFFATVQINAQLDLQEEIPLMRDGKPVLYQGQQVTEVFASKEARFGEKMLTGCHYDPKFVELRKQIEKELKNNDDQCPGAFNSGKVLLCEPTSTVNVIYDGATPEARRAFQYAADIYARVLNISTPVDVSFSFAALAPNVIGQAGPDGFFNVGGTVYPDALAEQLVGFDIGGPGDPDMNITFSSEFPFYFGLDGCAPDGTIDFVTIVLHEMMHGFGFLSSDFVFDSNDFPGFFGPGHAAGACNGFGPGGVLPYVFDLFLRSPSFGGIDPYMARTSPGVTPAGFGCFFGLEAYYTNNDLEFVGGNTSACFGGAARIYSPNPYRNGSSISHYDEGTYPGLDPNNLMTPFYSGVSHDFGCSLATLRDLGYDTADDVPECEVVPTMGEWGLASLGLILLILGVVTIKSRKLVFG